MSTSYLFLTSEHKKPRLIALGVSLVVVGVALAVLLRGGFSALTPDFSSLSASTLLYLSFVSGLFFLGVPLEAVLFTAVSSGSAPIASVAAMVAGFVLGNLVSYVIGWKLSRIALSLVSAKKMYGLRRRVNAHGSVYVFVANVLPFVPAPVLTFGLGVARYNMLRLFVFLVLGCVVKFSVTAYLAVLLA
ncbi:MAG: VTT domain-containing protein [Candidatus Woesearchaeota archaeon]